LYYAKQGIITPEMEYIAISENQRIEQLELKPKRCSANIKGTAGEQTHLKARLHQNLFVQKLLADAHHTNNINHPESEPMIVVVISW
jgi:phosphomethylpyrimidine synthase